MKEGDGPIEWGGNCRR